MSGDEGSFLTTILGVGLPRDLLEEGRLDSCGRAGGDMEVGEIEEEGWRCEE
jgi:hypothetical protein